MKASKLTFIPVGLCLDISPRHKHSSKGKDDFNMKYRNFYITYTVDNHVLRQNKDGRGVICKGWFYEVFADVAKTIKVDCFSAAVGYELPDDSEENAKLFIREFIDTQYKDYCRIAENMSEAAEQKQGGMV